MTRTTAQRQQAADIAMRNLLNGQSVAYLAAKPTASPAQVDRLYAKTLAITAARWTS